MFFKKKSRENEVSELFCKHAGMVGQVLESMEKTLELYMSGNEDFVKQSLATHQIEHEADQIAAQIREKLCEGAFIQGLRLDFATMIGKMEKIAGHAVIVCRIISEELPEIPWDIKKEIMTMARRTVELAPHLTEAFNMFQTDLSRIETACDAIKQVETDVDGILHKLITKLYRLDIELARKIQIKDLLIYLHRISDFAEEVTDAMGILAMNMRI